MKSAVVTGATGFIGRAVIKELLSNGYTVCAVVRPGSESKVLSHQNCKVVSCQLSDISQLATMIEKKSYDYFFHFAWDGASGQGRADASLQLKNAAWTVDACRVAKELGCKRFIVSGSIMERETFSATYTQGNRPGLGYIYGGAKMVAHAMSMSIANSIGIDLVWGSITNAYGPGERSPRLVNSTIAKCLRGESPRFTAGTQNYDFVYIDDVAKAFRLIAENGKPFHDYLIGSGHAKELKAFLLEMQEVVAPKLPFIFGDVPFTGVNLPLQSFDCQETFDDTGFKACIDFKQGCMETAKWLSE